MKRIHQFSQIFFVIVLLSSCRTSINKDSNKLILENNFENKSQKRKEWK